MVNKIVLVWCSPGFGLADVWLPVINKLKERDGLLIYFVFPQPSSIYLEEKTSDLFNISEKLLDRVIFSGYSGRWFSSDSLVEASYGVHHSKIDDVILRLSIRLNKGKLSRYVLLRTIGSFLLAVFKHIAKVRENYKGLIPYDVSLLSDASCVLYDATTEDKSSNYILKNELAHISKFSMLHGLDAIWLDKQFLCKKSVNKKPNLIVYSNSCLEHKGYKRCFGVLDKNIVLSGIVRHDGNWIKFISNNNLGKKIPSELFSKFVFIIGAPASPYNTPERKRKMLKNIYDLICVKHNIKLIIKTHPKESIDGIDGQIYKESFGSMNYGKKWMYSNKSPFTLGRKAIFACSFGSGVALDMLAIGKPTIDCLNLNGLTEYDTDESLRDEFNNPVFPIGHLGLVLIATSYSDLERHVDSILYDYEDTIGLLVSRYNDYFRLHNDSPVMVANDIYKRLFKN